MLLNFCVRQDLCKNVFSTISKGSTTYRYFSTKSNQQSQLFDFKRNNFLSVFKVHHFNRRQHSTRNRGKSGLIVVFVPLSALLFSVWAFVFGGLNPRKKISPDQPVVFGNDENIYVSRVEQLHKEKRARQYAALQELKDNDSNDS